MHCFFLEAALVCLKQCEVLEVCDELCPQSLPVKFAYTSNAEELNRPSCVAGSYTPGANGSQGGDSALG